MIVRVKMFAAARQAAGGESIELTLPDQATIHDLRQALAQSCPPLQVLLPHALFAIGTDYADNNTQIPQGAEVACIPPVSGG